MNGKEVTDKSLKQKVIAAKKANDETKAESACNRINEAIKTYNDKGWLNRSLNDSRSRNKVIQNAYNSLTPDQKVILEKKLTISIFEDYL